MTSTRIQTKFKAFKVSVAHPSSSNMICITPWLCIQSLFNFWFCICYLYLNMYLCKVNVPEWIKLEEYSPVVDNILFSVYILYCRSPVQFRMGRHFVVEVWSLLVNMGRVRESFKIQIKIQFQFNQLLAI